MSTLLVAGLSLLAGLALGFAAGSVVMVRIIAGEAEKERESHNWTWLE